MLGNIGSSEVIVILLVLILIFGSTKITQFARGLGESTKEIKKVKEAYENPDVIDDPEPEPPKKKRKKAKK